MRNAIIAGMLMAAFAGCAVTDDRDAAHNPAAHARAVIEIKNRLHEAFFFAVAFQDRNDEHIAPHIETKFERRACRALEKAMTDMERAKIGLHEAAASRAMLLQVDEAAHCGLGGRITLLPE